MPHLRIYAIVSPVSDIIAKATSGDIDASKLFGTNGNDGMVVQTDLTNSRKSLDGTKVIFKTNSGQTREGESDALQYLTNRADEESLTYTLHSAVPCQLVDDVYTALPDSNNWAPSALTNIHSELDNADWQTEE
tara:strand:- start:1847 stop:2248 length:402 start_codon:yes stop_codon:yes gene_type:complete